MQLVPAVTELIVAELLYLQYKDRQKPIYLYINSTGTTRADGETVITACAHDTCSHHQYVGPPSIHFGLSMLPCVQVGFETEGTAIYDTMQFVKNEVSNYFPCKALTAKRQDRRALRIFEKLRLHHPLPRRVTRVMLACR